MTDGTDKPSKCTDCGKIVDATVSMVMPGAEPTPPLCRKCFFARCRETVKFLKSVEKGALK